eukprot:scaffold10267_cov120-Skeletonema_dohrnii-CCMP3373.AAC.5
MSSLSRVEEEGQDPFPNHTSRAPPPRFERQPRQPSSGGRISLVSEPSFAQYNTALLARQDEDILTRTVQDCGLHAYGAIFVELWVLSSNGRHMSRPSGGHWMDPQFIHSISPPELAEQVNDHAQNCSPGVSLAGTLYNETSQWGHWGINRKVYWRQIKSMMDDPFVQDDGRLKSLYEDLGIGIVATVPFSYHGRNGIVLFMSRSTCSVDRLRSTANENFLIAAADLIGASFAIRIPRKEVANIRKEMMRSAVRKLMSLIKNNKGRNLGSIVQNMRSKGMQPSDSFANVLFKNCSDVTDGVEETQGVKVSQSSIRGSERPWRHPVHSATVYSRSGWSSMSTIAHRFSRRIVNSIRKWEGARMKGPARMSAPDCAIIFIMVTLAMLTILRMNDAFEDANPDNIYKWHLNGGWVSLCCLCYCFTHISSHYYSQSSDYWLQYASTMCIVFALSSAPVGQPRQIIGAHIINALVGLAFQQIPSTPAMDNFSDFAKLPPGQRGMPLFWKESFAVGVGVSLQAWLGVMHPPATGLAFSFANTDRYQLSNLAVVMLADVMLIVLATVLLNLRKNKQYPIFWFGMNWNYPSGKMHQLTSKTRNTTAELTERMTRRNIRKRQPQDHTPNSTAANSGGVENV